MQVDAPPPSLAPVAGPSGAASAAVGDLVTLTVYGLAGNTSVPVAPASVIVQVNGVNQTVSGLTPLGAADSYSVQFTLSGNFSAGPQNVTVGIGTRQSPGAPLTVHN